ncbi:G-PROTEIN-RECEP-F3-4 domain-containing protein [Aphelenchoides besseyi]|nr:G-PROTEIN-RECEP-F3-4 domain-containing protein [Aphelenchoides besseyi]
MFTVLAIVSQIFIGHVAIMAQGIKIEKPVSTGDDSIRQIRIPGDLILGGVFPVHAKGTLESSCGEISETRGVHRVEAMLYAMDTINEKSDFLRGYKLGALILDSCSNPSYALNQSLDFVRDMIGSTDVSEYQCNDGNQPLMRSNQKKKVVAVVGGSYSSVTVQVANLLRLFRIAQVSPASTNADLSDKSRFEYLARTVPSDNFQAQAMVDIASHFGWTYVSLVFSADEYGELGADAFKKEARRMNICIATEERISSKNESLRESVENLIKKLQPDKDVGARVVVLFVGTEYIPQLMNETAHQMNLAFNRRRQKQIIWLASESWDRNNEAYTDGVRRLSAEGAIVLMLESRRVPAFEDYYLSLHPGSKNFERNGWLKELWKRKFNCEFGLPVSSHNRCEEKKQSKESFNPDDKIQFVIDAVYAIAHGLQEMKFDICPNDTIETSWISRHSGLPDVCSSMKHIDGEEFYKKYLLNVKFKDLADTNFHFTPEGDGPARYTILNYQPSMSRHVDRSDYVVVGKWAEDKLYVNESLMFWNMDEASPGVPISQCSMRCKTGYRKQLIKADELCCWACSKCEDYEYLVNETTCADCGVGRLPNPDRKSCFYIKDHDLQHMQLNSWYSIIPSIFAVIGIVITLIVIIIFAAHNDTPVVKASGRELSYILLISIILCYSMTFVLIAPPTALTCALKRTGISFSFSCVYSAILVKTNRIYRIFSSATRSAKRPGCISPISQVLLTAMLASIQLIASLIWLFIVPPGTRYKYPTRTQVVLTCRVDDVHFLYSLTFAAILLILCTVYAVQTRQVPENFNETKYVGFSMYTTCVVWVSCICFLFGTANNFQIQITSLCISISMSANVVLVCIFAPKLYIIIFEKHKNVRKKDGDHSIHRKWNSGCSYTNALTKSRDQSNGDPTAYTALLADQRRRNSRKFSQPSSSTTTNAHDTFL